MAAFAEAEKLFDENARQRNCLMKMKTSMDSMVQMVLIGPRKQAKFRM